MVHVMLDLETMGINPSSPIVAIGAVVIDMEQGELGSVFYEVIDLTSAVELGAIMDTSTVLWWLKQSDEARKIFSGPSVHISKALMAFADWLRSKDTGKGVCVWGNGSDFDNVLLISAYQRAGIPVPWKFWNNRCYRTVKSMNPDVKMQRSGVHHNALDDAKSQALHLIEILRKTGYIASDA